MDQLPGQLSLFDNMCFKKEQVEVIKSALAWYIADQRVKKSCYKNWSKKLDHPKYLEAKHEEDKACEIYDLIKSRLESAT